MCGLQPNHTYYFAVGGDGWWGNVYPMTTARPLVGSTDPLRFIAMGDSNFFYSLYAQLQATVSTYAPAFTLFTGDMIHDGTYAGRLGAVVRRRRLDARDACRR